VLAPIRGLSPFAASAFAAGDSNIPTGLSPSPLGGVRAFTQPMLRFDVLPRVGRLTRADARVDRRGRSSIRCSAAGADRRTAAGGERGHQAFNRFPPRAFYGGATGRTDQHQLRSAAARAQFGCRGQHALPSLLPSVCRTRTIRALWTFNGSVP
jgi:hypothetical protein